MEADTIADLDRRILTALWRTPRASYRDLGRAVGAPDHAVRRRYLAMGQHLGLRVSARAVSDRLGWDSWIVRIKADPSAIGLLGRVLASRPDTRWVRAGSGGTELASGLLTRTDLGDTLTPLVEQLPARHRPHGVTAHLMLAELGPQIWTWLGDVHPAGQPRPARTDAPSPTPAGDAEAPSPTPAGGADAVWSSSDDALLRELRRDGRATCAQLALSTGWHESTVRRRVAHLMRSGLLEFDVDLDESAVGRGATAQLWLRVDIAQLRSAATMLAGHDEVSFVAAITGGPNLFVAVACADVGHLYRFLVEDVSRVPGLRDVETIPVSHTFKRSAFGAG